MPPIEPAGPSSPALPPSPSSPEPAAPGAERRRLHPFSLVFLLINRAKQAIPLFALALVSRTWLVLLVVLLLWAAQTVLEWWRRTWVLDGGVLRIEEGILGRKQRAVPLDRIQQVDIRRKPLHRLFGVASLRVETGGGSGNAEVDLDALSVATASSLRRALLAGRAGAPRVAAAGVDDGAASAETVPAAPPERVVARLSLGRVVLAGVTGARAFAVLAILGPILQYSDDFDIDVAGWLIDRAQDEQIWEVGALGIITVLISLVVVWFLLAAGTGILLDYGFTMTISGDDLRVRRGLLERREVVMPLSRVQVVRVGESLVRRTLGMATVQVSSGGGSGEGASRVAVPILRTTELDAVLAQVLPAAAPLPALRRPPRVARRRAGVRMLFPLGLLGALAGLALWFTAGGADGAAYRWVLAGAAAGALLAPAYGLAVWRNLGHAFEREALFARTGVAIRWTAIVPATKAQSLRVTSGLFQRRAGLASLQVDVAGGSPNPTVVDETGDRAEDLAGRLISLGSPRARAGAGAPAG